MGIIDDKPKGFENTEPYDRSMETDDDKSKGIEGRDLGENKAHNAQAALGKDMEARGGNALLKNHSPANEKKKASSSSDIGNNSLKVLCGPGKSFELNELPTNRSIIQKAIVEKEIFMSETGIYIE